MQLSGKSAVRLWRNSGGEDELRVQWLQGYGFVRVRVRAYIRNCSYFGTFRPCSHITFKPHGAELHEDVTKVVSWMVMR